MEYRIGFIHATPNGIQPMMNALNNQTTKIDCLHFLDEGLLDEVNSSGSVSKKLVRRLIKLIEKAEASNVDGVALSCSSFTPYVPLVEQLFDFPIVSVDYAMLEKAVEMGSNIGVIATVGAAGPTTTNLVYSIAHQTEKPVTVYTETLIEASKALKMGEVEKHDQMIQQKIKELSSFCDVIIIAQLSMTRALNDLEPIPVPILSSAETSVSSLLSKLSILK
ncbi:aspartate/glutamate racemase family protein [Neobacillus niacini]|uniref:aspartate/glutamate racemase family protein n=1 Tax=Neobacillus niacini TaxID=86668 RepID=UPI002FFEA372